MHDSEGKSNQMDNQDIIDNLTKVCICKGVSRRTIKKAIADGAGTVEEVWQMTNTGNGGCKGRRCRDRIRQLLEQYQSDS